MAGVERPEPYRMSGELALEINCGTATKNLAAGANSPCYIELVSMFFEHGRRDPTKGRRRSCIRLPG